LLILLFKESEKRLFHLYFLNVIAPSFFSSEIKKKDEIIKTNENALKKKDKELEKKDEIIKANENNLKRKDEELEKLKREKMKIIITKFNC
jgi:PDZ domain-containing secreted protein